LVLNTAVPRPATLIPAIISILFRTPRSPIHDLVGWGAIKLDAVPCDQTGVLDLFEVSFDRRTPRPGGSPGVLPLQSDRARGRFCLQLLHFLTGVSPGAGRDVAVGLHGLRACRRHRGIADRANGYDQRQLERFQSMRLQAEFVACLPAPPVCRGGLPFTGGGMTSLLPDVFPSTAAGFRCPGRRRDRRCVWAR